MPTRRTLVILIIMAVIIGAPLAWWLGSPLFIDNPVDEDFPFEIPTTAEIAAMSPEEVESRFTEIMGTLEEPGVMDAMSAEEAAQVQASLEELSVAMPTKEMDEESPEAAAAEWMLVSQGTFRDADSFHQGSGTAAIFQLGDERVLRLEDFEVTNGPDLHVILVENVEGTNRDSIGEHVDLGPLKGNIGNQNYTIPADVDLSRYSGVMIYCVPFHVVFATAPMAAGS